MRFLLLIVNGRVCIRCSAMKKFFVCFYLLFSNFCFSVDYPEKSIAYDANGNISKCTPPHAGDITYSYDPINRLAETRYPNGESIKYTYDYNSNLTKVAKGILNITEVWPTKLRAFQSMGAQEHLWEYYTRVAMQRGAQSAHNSAAPPMKYGEAYQRVFPTVRRSFSENWHDRSQHSEGSDREAYSRVPSGGCCANPDTVFTVSGCEGLSTRLCEIVQLGRILGEDSISHFFSPEPM